MTKWNTVGPETMLSNGQIAEVETAGVPILLARTGDQYYATQARCPHLRARLARGSLDGFVIKCPAHGSRFDIRDGSNVEWIAELPGPVRTAAQLVSKPKGLRTYPTRVEDGQVWVSLEDRR